MPANNLFVVKEKYRALNYSLINDLRTSYTKFLTKNAAFSPEQLLQKEMVIKKMIVALEETVKVLEKKVNDLRKEQKELE